MKPVLRVLLVEDNEDDALLVIEELKRGGFDPIYQRVETGPAMSAALRNDAWDIVISDYAMPRFSGLKALEVLQESGLDLPFIIVSGTIGEETAVGALKAGANDYIMKDKLVRFVPAVHRALQEVQEHVKRTRAEKLQNALYRIAHAAAGSRHLQDLYRSVHEIISEVMAARNFYVALYDEKKDLISFPYFVDEHDEAGPPVKPGKGLTEYVLHTGQSLLCNRATHEELIKRGEAELVGVPSVIWLGVPLTIDKKTIGVMAVQHYSDEKTYGDSEKAMLEFVSSQVATTIQNKLSEESLRRSEEQFRLISENVADMITVLDLSGKRLYNSPSYRPIVGDPEVLQGTDSFQEIHPEDRERIRGLFKETVKTGIGQRAEYRFLAQDGSVRFIESQGSVIRDRNGNVAQVVVVSRDVTEKKQLEEQYFRAQRMESIGTLAGGIAHDLNNVLSPILLGVGMIRRKVTDPAAQKMLEMMETTAKRGADLIRQVLSFARGMEGEHSIVQARHLISEVEKIIRETFPKSIALRIDIPKDLWTIPADATQLHQVLMNLCVNARDAMPQGGTLEIKAENVRVDEQFRRMHLEAQQGPHVILRVTDSGIGMTPEVLEKIFEPFFTTKKMGTGIGLSTVHAIVKSHKGFITAYSEPGKGTAFNVHLPAQEGVAAHQMEQKPEIPAGHGEMILLVEDEAAIREITRATLEAFGYNVMAAIDGTEAVAVYAQDSRQIALVITDMMMPYMDGATTIRALRRINPNVKIIAVSGLSPQSLAGLGDGVVFLHKPFTSETLLEAVGSMLKSSPVS